jgi:hypothetical protein
MDETSALPFFTSPLYPGVVSFSPDAIPESIRKLEANASLFPEGGCSVPALGTFCTTDSSPQAQQMLSLLARRNSFSFMLLVAFPESVEAEGEILTPSVRRTLLTLLADSSLGDVVTRWSAVLNHSLRAVSDVLTAASEEEFQELALQAKTSFTLGIVGMEPFMTGLPLLPIATLSLTQHDSSRQSVGSHGDIT